MKKASKKLYQKVNNKPKKFGNNNVNSINIILNPDDEKKQLQRPGGGAGSQVIQELARITPPSLEDARQVLGRAQRLGEPVGDIDDVRKAGMSNEVQAALVEEAQRQQVARDNEELQSELDQRDSIIGSFAESIIENMSNISSNASEIFSLRADTENDVDELNRELRQHQSRELENDEAILQREANMLKLEELMNEDDFDEPPVGAITQQQVANMAVNQFLTPPTAGRPETSDEVNPLRNYSALEQRFNQSRAEDERLKSEIEELRTQLLTPVRTPSPQGPRNTPTAPRDITRLQSRVSANTQQIPMASITSQFARNQDAVESRLLRRPPRKRKEPDMSYYKEADI